MLKLLPNIWIRLEQIHVFKISFTAEQTVSLFIWFPKAIIVFFLLFAWWIPPLLQGLFPIASFITYIDFIFFEHSYASLSLLFYCLLEISYQFILHVIMSISLTSYKLHKGGGSLQLIVSLSSSSSIHPRTVSCIQWLLKIICWFDFYPEAGLDEGSHLIAQCLMLAAGSLKEKTQTRNEDKKPKPQSKDECDAK